MSGEQRRWGQDLRRESGKWRWFYGYGGNLQSKPAKWLNRICATLLPISLSLSLSLSFSQTFAIKMQMKNLWKIGGSTGMPSEW